MKKFVALLVMISLILGSVSPLYVFAENDQVLEKVIKLAKEKFYIPDNFTEFNYDVHMLDDKKVWNMHWHSKEDKDGSIEVSINDTGHIISYYSNRYKNYDEKKLPKYSKEEGKKIADGFIKKVDANLFSQLKYEADQHNQIAEEYGYHYVRMINNIPFYGNNVRTEVDSETGKVTSFYCNWNDVFSFPKPEKIISLEEAQKAFQEKLGLEMIYKYRYDEKAIKPYLVYTSKYKQDASIDAFTGEKVEMKYPIRYGRGGNAKEEVSSDGAAIELSPEELKAVKEASKLLSKEDAEKIARNTKILELTKFFKLMNASLNRDWLIKKDFTWYLYFNKEKEENGESVVDYVNVGIDGITGKIKSFYLSDQYREDEKAVFDKETSKKEVEKFLAGFAKDQYIQTEYDKDDYENADVEKTKKTRSYTFTYTRKVNNIPFRDNAITVGYNAVTGKIRSFDLRWFDVNFPSTKNIASLDQAYDKMFQDIGLELQYKSSLEDARVPYEKKDGKIKLVYALNSGKPVIFDGRSLEILNYDGKPYKEQKDIAYRDIEGHDAQEAIQALAKYGIGFEEDTFKPDQKIVQKDFFRLFVKTLNYYASNRKEDEAIKEMYDYLIREKIVKENEKSEEHFLTKEDSVKFMIRALKYDEVAKIEGIYKYPFKDIEQASKNLIGYITIANGLGIVKGNNDVFEPKKEMTRGEAAIMIYHYLKR
ncbi:YcdB/YcdC domain-containing protein [Marinisporobacter balticus]|uniref:S-layer family protein n=1 Tax=Marinisporobacter balticus TaxID=2018667 RepID=A0A4R2KUB1_9FIRM|nr:YcdB/YcdC domain-containing protein [Marinisporobacter balticus]TCO77464.1 S-layer family protein [Marinisporobacter balticus]